MNYHFIIVFLTLLLLFFIKQVVASLMLVRTNWFSRGTIFSLMPQEGARVFNKAPYFIIFRYWHWCLLLFARNERNPPLEAIKHDGSLRGILASFRGDKKGWIILDRSLLPFEATKQDGSLWGIISFFRADLKCWILIEISLSSFEAI